MPRKFLNVETKKIFHAKRFFFLWKKIRCTEKKFLAAGKKLFFTTLKIFLGMRKHL